MDASKIKRWMRAHVASFVDECGEVNATALTEAWDRECDTGEATRDPHHVAWDVAVNVAEEREKSIACRPAGERATARLNAIDARRSASKAVE